MMVRVLPADRQPLFNRALEALFTEDGRYQVVGPCYRQEDVLQAVRLLQPELLLVDSEAALSGTPTVIERALAERQGLKVLVLATLAAHGSPRSVEAAEELSINRATALDGGTPAPSAPRM